jgi:hypothetical protein
MSRSTRRPPTRSTAFWTFTKRSRPFTTQFRRGRGTMFVRPERKQRLRIGPRVTGVLIAAHDADRVTGGKRQKLCGTVWIKDQM